jgi:hypothetical protein
MQRCYVTKGFTTIAAYVTHSTKYNVTVRLQCSGSTSHRGRPRKNCAPYTCESFMQLNQNTARQKSKPYVGMTQICNCCSTVCRCTAAVQRLSQNNTTCPLIDRQAGFIRTRIMMSCVCATPLRWVETTVVHQTHAKKTSGDQPSEVPCQLQHHLLHTSAC